MPAKSVAQQHLMQAAEHGADFPMATKLRESMTHDQLHDFSTGSEAGKPTHAPSFPPPAPAPSLPSPQAPLLQGMGPSIVGSNTNTLRQGGLSEIDAIKSAIGMASKPKVSRHGNLGKYLHPRKDGKPHGSENI